jgi:hypothetical protein
VSKDRLGMMQGKHLETSIFQRFEHPIRQK